MITAFRWEQPGWLVAFIVLVAILAARARLNRADRTRRPVLGGAGEPGRESDPPSHPGELRGSPTTATRAATVRWLVTLLVGGAAALLGFWLANVATSGSFLALGVLAFVAAGRLTLAVYRRQPERLARWTQTAPAALRCLACWALLVLLGRPVCDWRAVTWQKPLLVVLLDESESMSISDADGPTSRPPRAQLVNAALERSRTAVARLGELYEVRLMGIGAGCTPLHQWHIAPSAPLSALASAMRTAAAMRSQHGVPPAGILLVSDGAENVGSPADLRHAAAGLAGPGTALWAAGVGPSPGQTPLVELEPLAVPGRLGLRDQVRVPVAARVQGCSGVTLALALLWDNQVVATRSIRVEREIQHVGDELDVVPPGPGLHRLVARISLPPERGGAAFETSAIVEVRNDRIRVLWVEAAPRTETAVVSRTLQADSQVELSRSFLYAAPDAELRPAADQMPDWWAYDVVVLDAVPKALSDESLRALATAVTERGAGVLLAGGRKFFNDSDRGHEPLRNISPVKPVRDEFGLTGPVRFVPTELGRLHPVLAKLGAAGPDSAPATPPDEQAAWRALPALGGAALLGEPRPAAIVLADNGDRRPLLVAQDVGRGRCVAAAWENTWPWALASDEGTALHRRLWRQLIVWLANRRPQAWVLTDQATYSSAALASGQRKVEIRAGLSGVDESAGPSAGARYSSARLVLIKGQSHVEIELQRHGDDWEATWPMGSDIGAPHQSPSGSEGPYTLEFRVSAAGGSNQSRPATGSHPADQRLDELEARTSFVVTETSPERQPPTANLTLLQAAAAETTSAGGGYCGVDELPGLLERIARTDRRREVWTTGRFGPVEGAPWALLIVLTAALGLEWVLRKRAGLA